MNDYTTSQQCEGEQFAFFLSCQFEQSDFFHSNIIVITFPQHNLQISIVWIVISKTMTRFCSPALNAGHGFIYPLDKLSFVSFQM